MTPHSAKVFWRIVNAGGDLNLHDIFAALDTPSEDHRLSLEPGVPVGVLLFKARLVRRPAYRSSGSRPGVCKVLLLI